MLLSFSARPDLINMEGKHSQRMENQHEGANLRLPSTSTNSCWEATAGTWLCSNEEDQMIAQLSASSFSPTHNCQEAS